MGQLRIAVVWTWEREDRFVLTVNVNQAPRPLEGD